mmetsp:Transcript_8877/g.16990  ORF Transcript_8877/g.16990 Transcript_8877/m.16990 type:complete len:285 (-) Transcript_8877:1516-2370(-)
MMQAPIAIVVGTTWIANTAPFHSRLEKIAHGHVARSCSVGISETFWVMGKIETVLPRGSLCVSATPSKLIERLLPVAILLLWSEEAALELGSPDRSPRTLRTLLKSRSVSRVTAFRCCKGNAEVRKGVIERHCYLIADTSANWNIAHAFIFLQTFPIACFHALCIIKNRLVGEVGFVVISKKSLNDSVSNAGILHIACHRTTSAWRCPTRQMSGLFVGVQPTVHLQCSLVSSNDGTKRIYSAVSVPETRIGGKNPRKDATVGVVWRIVNRITANIILEIHAWVD